MRFYFGVCSAMVFSSFLCSLGEAENRVSRPSGDEKKVTYTHRRLKAQGGTVSETTLKDPYRLYLEGNRNVAAIRAASTFEQFPPDEAFEYNDAFLTKIQKNYDEQATKGEEGYKLAIQRATAGKTDHYQGQGELFAIRERLGNYIAAANAALNDKKIPVKPKQQMVLYADLRLILRAYTAVNSMLPESTSEKRDDVSGLLQLLSIQGIQSDVKIQ